MEQTIDTLDKRLAAIEEKQTGMHYVLFGYEKRPGIINEIQDHDVRIKAIEKTIVKWGGILVSAQLIIGAIFTIINIFYRP